MRYRGRVIVKKVDFRGVPIKGKLAAWIKKNPGKVYYDSMIEYEAITYLNKNRIEYTYQPTLMLYDSMKTEEFKKNKIVDYSQRNIKFTPDIYLPKKNVYIELKGYADDVFKLRWKLFKLKGYKGFIVYSMLELKNLLKQLEKTKK